MSVLRSPLINPLRSPLYSPLLSSVAWWGDYNPSTGFAYDFKLNRYMSQGKSTGITQVVTEGRSTDAYVLDGGGNYILRSANEPAQANGHGLDGFDEYTNDVLASRAIDGVTFNAPSPVAFTGVTPFGDVGGRVYTSTGRIQTNTTITADSNKRVLSRLFKPLGTGVKYRTDLIGIAGSDTNSCVFDFDTMTIDSGLAPFSIEALSSGWFRLSWLFQNDGAGNTMVWREDVDANSNYACDQTDTYIGDFVRPPIITTGTAFTRDADDTRVVQGDDGGSPTIAPGFTANPNELTFRVDWDGVAVNTGAARYLFEVSNSPGKRVTLLFAGNQQLWLGADEGGFQLINAGSSFDDGAAHTAVCYFNRTTSLFKMSVDGGTTLSATLTGVVPPNLDQAFINHRSDLRDRANGTNCRIQVSEGDFYDDFRDSSAGFF